MSNIITLPKWLSVKPKRFITRSGGKLMPDDIALRFALSIRIHGGADKLRSLAGKLVGSVCLEYQPTMRSISRMANDTELFDSVLRIINRACDMLNILPGTQFKRVT